MGYIFAFTFMRGSYGIWLAFSLSNVVGGLLSIAWVKYGDWAKAVVRRS
ncbi:MAG: hypothetical protein NDF52_03670 [archaeon YNP-WB-062]|jgi:Na+-driven multidrug efflux pump|nr:hypothetical protein [Candidatus Culexarchaeum yellowstonense]